MVFPGNDETGAFSDWWKFIWIARIAGYNGTDYIHIDPSIGGTLTPKAGQATMMRLMFDDQFQPHHFTKIYKNRVAKIYRVDYPASTLSQASIVASWPISLDRAHSRSLLITPQNPTEVTVRTSCSKTKG